MNSLDRLTLALQRAEVYRLLAVMYSTPLDADSLAHMVAAAKSGEPGIDNGATTSLMSVLAETPASTVESLAHEFTRLFRGINEAYGPPPPYESLWREGQMMGETTRQVAEFFLDAGYQPDGRLSPCDHLAEECKFMAALCIAEAESDMADPTGMAVWTAQQRAFIDSHLSAWVPDYCVRIEREAREPLYRALATTKGLFF